MDLTAVVGIVIGVGINLVLFVIPQGWLSRGPGRRWIIGAVGLAIVYGVEVLLMTEMSVMRFGFWPSVFLGAVVCAVGGGAVTSVAWRYVDAQLSMRAPTPAEIALQQRIQYLIDSGEITRDAFWDDLKRLREGELISHIDLYRRVQIERWREQLQECIEQQNVLRPEVRGYVVTGSFDRISESISRLREVLRDWHQWRK